MMSTWRHAQARSSFHALEGTSARCAYAATTSDVAGAPGAMSGRAVGHK